MSWLYSRALVEEYSEANCSDGDAFVQLSTNHIPPQFSRSDRMTAFSRLSRFGMTFAPLTADRGEELLMSYLAAFPARTSQLQDEAKALTESEAGFGEKWHESLTKYNPDSRSWKTRQHSLLGGLDEFSETWPRWGSMRNGECWEQPTLERPTDESESGLWATPLSQDAKHSGHAKSGPGKADKLAYQAVRWPTPQTRGYFNDGDLQALAKACDSWEEMSGMAYRANSKKKVQYWPTPNASDDRDRGNLSSPAIQRRMEIGKQVNLSMCVSEKSGRLNPEWVEWLMGWPRAWTDLKPLATDRCRSAPQKHSESCMGG